MRRDVSSIATDVAAAAGPIGPSGTAAICQGQAPAYALLNDTEIKIG
jgi:hypothetical protein